MKAIRASAVGRGASVPAKTRGLYGECPTAEPHLISNTSILPQAWRIKQRYLIEKFVHNNP